MLINQSINQSLVPVRVTCLRNHLFQLEQFCANIEVMHTCPTSVLDIIQPQSCSCWSPCVRCTSILYCTRIRNYCHKIICLNMSDCIVLVYSLNVQTLSLPRFRSHQCENCLKWNQRQLSSSEFLILYF